MPTEAVPSAVVVTALRRPYYLRPVLASWRQARDIGQWDCFIALGRSDRDQEQLQVIRQSGLHPAIIRDKQPQFGKAMHAAIADAADRVFGTHDFAVFGEEDVLVSRDVLEYMAVCRDTFASNESVLAVCAHSKGGQGWDDHAPAQDGEADQWAVSLRGYFNAWVWGTWKDRWNDIMRPSWDRHCNKGGPATSGWDWNIQLRMVESGGYLCAVPDASRSQNIGRLEGWASSEESFAFAAAQSYRQFRSSGSYRFAS